MTVLRRALTRKCDEVDTVNLWRHEPNRTIIQHIFIPMLCQLGTVASLVGRQVGLVQSWYTNK